MKKQNLGFAKSQSGFGLSQTPGQSAETYNLELLQFF